MKNLDFFVVSLQQKIKQKKRDMETRKKLYVVKIWDWKNCLETKLYEDKNECRRVADEIEEHMVKPMFKDSYKREYCNFTDNGTEKKISVMGWCFTKI